VDTGKLEVAPPNKHKSNEAPCILTFSTLVEIIVFVHMILFAFRNPFF
jgi:hypothetical protein